MKKLVLLSLSFLLFGLSLTMGQELTVKTYGVSPRDVAKDTVEMYFDRAYNGLMNVGNETKVFLKGQSDEALTGSSWSFLMKPAGSNATFGTTFNMDDYTQLISFIPDLIGTYKIEFTDGAGSATIIINSAEYFGVEGGVISCVGCHNTGEWDYKFDKWSETAHATMLEDGLNGIASNHYGPNCISCHTVGYDTYANNNGFDDFPFVFPDTLYPGVYDQMMSMYPEAMARGNIQCESCHGPGGNHYGIISNSKMVSQIETDNCAWCHDAGSHHIFPEQWDHSGEDATEYDGRGFHGGHAIGAFVGSAGNRNGCSPCHSGSGYIQWVKEGRPVNSLGLPSGTNIIPEGTNISCAVCHDPHSDANAHQLRFEDTQLGDGTSITMDLYGMGAQCMDCHRSRRYAFEYASDPENASSHYGAHHGPQADMLIGANAPDYGMTFPTSPHSIAGGNACVDCHMEGEEFEVGGHSFNMNDAEGNDHVEACAPCHGNVGETFKEKKYYINGNADLDGNGVAEGLQLEVHGLMEQLSEFLPHDEDGNVSITEDNADSLALTPEIMRGGYVYMWIEEDRSFGIHNPAFTISLLKAAIEELGGVTSIDYPDSGVLVEYQLSQNYPNPFNPSTTIEFSIPEQSNVRIGIYDALGNQLDVVYDGLTTAGNHKVTWTANNYASGIYFYRMETDNFMEVKKMLLMK